MEHSSFHLLHFIGMLFNGIVMQLQMGKEAGLAYYAVAIKTSPGKSDLIAGEPLEVHVYVNHPCVMEKALWQNTSS